MGDVKEQIFQADNPRQKELLEKVYRKHYDKLVWYASKITKSSDVSEEIVMEALVRFIKRAPEAAWKTEREATQYICAIVRNLCLNWRRANAVREHLSLDNRTEEIPSLFDLIAAVDEDIEGMVEKREKLSQLNSVLERLKPRQRECIRLHYIYDLSYAGVAQRMGLSEEAARKLGNRAVKKLRSLLEAEQ